MASGKNTKSAVSQKDYEQLAAFRYELRRFLNFSERAAKALGMTPQQHQSLLAIRAAPDRTMAIGDLAEQLFVQPHTASELAERMIALGWLERHASPHDRRRVMLGLTSQSEAMLGKMSTTHRAEVLRIRSTLTDILGGLSED
ncbi:MarR family winged helix-turn-helix transcriptional regulator [Sphingomonas montanisoli]|uniref:MarR family transcriptional regulator n=1 Tax=Sphingomonas montanisoli TaxID=2606412 RepID=A0A5D9CB00_9SPHN|nr:helix-turn-helix domain-containing protein [Sphingomonas montanisoli]TZG27291.1 MarR family transcriptional regulator [Sphingomonas montanisoli]